MCEGMCCNERERERVCVSRVSVYETKCICICMLGWVGEGEIRGEHVCVHVCASEL